MKKVSVIVPCYNVELYLKKCVDSLLKQTYYNIEIILVDDGSTDKSGEICDECAISDDRVIVVHKKNGGLSDARNVGIKKSTGKYIMFIDPDDWIDLNAIEVSVKCIEENENVQVCIFPYVKEFINNSVKTDLFENKGLFLSFDTFNNVYRRFFGPIENELKFPDRIDQLNSAWGKLYKREVVENVEFIDTKIIGTEDALFNIYVFKNVTNIYYTNEIYYHYFKDNSSSLTRNYKKDFHKKWAKLYSYMNEEIINNKLDEKFITALNNRIALSTLTLVINVVSSNLKFREKYKEIKIILSDETYSNALNKLDFKYFDFKWKLFYFLEKHKVYLLVMFLCYIADKIRRFRK